MLRINLLAKDKRRKYVHEKVVVVCVLLGTLLLVLVRNQLHQDIQQLNKQVQRLKTMSQPVLVHKPKQYFAFDMNTVPMLSEETGSVCIKQLRLFQQTLLISGRADHLAGFLRIYRKWYKRATNMNVIALKQTQQGIDFTLRTTGVISNAH